jgi:hypothetical protein
MLNYIVSEARTGRVGDMMRKSMRHTTGSRWGPALLLVSPLSACGGTTPPPEPGQSRGVPPDLRGRRVILLPVQRVVGVAGDPDAELAFTLRDRGREVDWILSGEVSRVLARSPAIQTQITGLPVGLFLQGEVQRIGDPLFGQIRRMAALVAADAVLLPVRASFERDSRDSGASPRVRFTAALVEARSGRVLWFGVEEGGDFPREDPRGLASAVECLARTLLWYVPT